MSLKNEDFSGHTFKKCPTTSMREIDQCNVDEFNAAKGIVHCVPLHNQVLEDVNVELHMQLNSLGIYYTKSPR